MNDTTDYPAEIEQLSKAMTAPDAIALLQGLADRAKNDPGEPFKPEPVKALIVLEDADQPAHHHCAFVVEYTLQPRPVFRSEVVVHDVLQRLLQTLRRAFRGTRLHT